jgi:hypothetical protein
MNALLGTIRNGQIILDTPAALPEGSRVEILPVHSAEAIHGMREADWPTTSEGIAALLARMDAVEPGWMTPEDESAWRAELQNRKEQEKRQFLTTSDSLRSHWE